MTVTAVLAMSEEQAKREGCPRCMWGDFMNKPDFYFKMDDIPEDLCVSKSIGWEKEICMTKTNFAQLVRDWNLMLLPSEWEFIRSVNGDYIWIMGFGD